MGLISSCARWSKQAAPIKLPSTPSLIMGTKFWPSNQEEAIFSACLDRSGTRRGRSSLCLLWRWNWGGGGGETRVILGNLFAKYWNLMYTMFKFFVCFLLGGSFRAVTRFVCSFFLLVSFQCQKGERAYRLVMVHF